MSDFEPTTNPDEVLRRYEKELDKIYSYLHYPPFTLKTNVEKVKAILKMIYRIQTKTAEKLNQGEDIESNLFKSIMTDNKEMFKEAEKYMARSSNDPIAAAEFYRQGNDPTNITSPSGPPPGWVP